MMACKVRNNSDLTGMAEVKKKSNTEVTKDNAKHKADVQVQRFYIYIWNKQ